MGPESPNALLLPRVATVTDAFSLILCHSAFAIFYLTFGSNACCNTGGLLARIPGWIEKFISRVRKWGEAIP